MGVAMPLQMIWTQIIGSKNIANYPELLQNSGGWIIRVMLDIVMVSKLSKLFLGEGREIALFEW